jgi:hypothetical protein
MFVLQPMSYKWSAENPYPGYKRVAQDMGIMDVYARRVARDLEQKRFLRRLPRVRSSNEFDLNPLFETLAKHAATANRRRKKQKAKPKIRKGLRNAD